MLSCQSTLVPIFITMTISSTIKSFENPALVIRKLFTSPSTTSKLGSLRLLPLKIKATYHNQLPYSSNAQPLFTQELNQPTKSLETQLALFEFHRYMAMKKKIIHKALSEAVPLQHPEKIHEAMRYSLLPGGKRIRPVLCLACCELLGGDESLAIPTACAIEMIQAMSLMHDDLPCMDNDDLRHGQPTNHRAFGEATAILAGMLFSHLHLSTWPLVTRQLIDVNISPENALRVITELGSAFGSLGAAGGQFMDMYSERKEVTLEELEQIHVLKSSKLIEASGACGAIIGGGTEIEVERLRKFASFIGLLVQVVKDILDVTKSSEELRKMVGKALGSDRATYPKLMGIEGAKNFAGQLVTQAFEELAHFDTVRAAPLYGLANYIYGQC